MNNQNIYGSYVGKRGRRFCAHTFFTMLEGGVKLARMRDGIYTYPEDFIKRYNDCALRMENQIEPVNDLIKEMDSLYQEQWEYVGK